MSKLATARPARRAAILHTRRLARQRHDEETTKLIRLARSIMGVMRAEAAADQMEDHARRIAAWRRLEEVRGEAARAGLIDEVEHLIRSAQRGRAGGPTLRTHGDVLRRWR